MILDRERRFAACVIKVWTREDQCRVRLQGGIHEEQCMKHLWTNFKRNSEDNLYIVCVEGSEIKE